MVATEKLPALNAPVENFSRGLFQAEIPGLGNPIRGKVRDNWIINKGSQQFRLMVTTDRQSAYARTVCTVPGKGQISNLISAFWFEHTKDIIPNHMIMVPHLNILLARQAKAVVPVEVVLRRYLARGISPTSVYHNYFNLGRRESYGIKFPDDLRVDQEFPMGTILTPTTKARNGHDQELTNIQACELADGNLRDGTWDKVKSSAFEIFERARAFSLSRGLILADTKMEFGLDSEDNLILIDEVLTPECSRFWPCNKYADRFTSGENQDIDKDVLLRWLINNGFVGEGVVPKIPSDVINQMAEIYEVP